MATCLFLCLLFVENTPSTRRFLPIKFPAEVLYIIPLGLISLEARKTTITIVVTVIVYGCGCIDPNKKKSTKKKHHEKQILITKIHIVTFV